MLEALTQGAGIYSSRRAGQTGAAAADGPDRAAADGKTQIAQALTCTVHAYEGTSRDLYLRGNLLPNLHSLANAQRT